MQIKVGDGVKVYRGPTFGREDGTVRRVREVGVIDAVLIRSKAIVKNLRYRRNAGEGENYWVELPDGYTPGSEGH